MPTQIYNAVIELGWAVLCLSYLLFGAIATHHPPLNLNPLLRAIGGTLLFVGCIWLYTVTPAVLSFMRR